MSLLNTQLNTQRRGPTRPWLFAGALAISALSACAGGTQRTECGPESCSGCCDESGACRPGDTELRCGKQGAQCTACAQGSTCEANVCVTPSSAIEPEDEAEVEPTEGGDGSDGGVVVEPDAGVDPCADAVYDSMLGTLKLAPGTKAVAAAPVASDLIAFATTSKSVYAVDMTSQSIVSLGEWPQLAPNPTKVHDIIPAAERGAGAYVSGFLAHDGQRLLAGYTKATSGFPGQVTVVDPQAPSTATWVSAAGNYSAAGVPGAFFINGIELGGLGPDPAVYALARSSTSTSTSASDVTLELATFDASWGAASGPTAVTANQVAVFGYFNTVDFLNHLRAVPPSKWKAALSGGKSFSLNNAMTVYSGDDVFAVAGFGDGLAIHRGTFDPVTYAAMSKDLIRVGLTLGAPSASTGETLTIEPQRTLLTAPDTCTSITQLASFGDDLLVGVQDRDGHRLVQLQLTR